MVLDYNRLEQIWGFLVWVWIFILDVWISILDFTTISHQLTFFKSICFVSSIFYIIDCAPRMSRELLAPMLLGTLKPFLKTPYFCSFELDKFGELLQNPFLYLRLSTPQHVDSCAKSVKVSTYYWWCNQKRYNFRILCLF